MSINNKRLRFEKIDPDSNNPTWRIVNKKREIIGFIFRHKDWKRHVFQADDGIIFSFGCLQEIVDFIRGLGGKP